MQYAKTLDEFFASKSEWGEALAKLRKLALSTELKETLKWGIPVYTFDGKNVVGLGAFKAYVGLWFYQGVLLKDKAEVLINAQEGKTRAMRQWRFQSAEDIDEELVLRYMEEAIENQKAGKEIKPSKPKSKPLVIPDELKTALNDNAALKNHFDSLSLSCRREYAEYIGEAKRPETRERRLKKSETLILAGEGLNDKYKK